MPATLAGTIGLALFNAGASLAVVNAVTFGVYWGTTAALFLAPTLLSSRPSTPTIRPSDGQVTASQAVQPRMKSIGTVRVAGYLFFFDASHPDGVLYHGVILNHGRIGAFVDYVLDENVCSIDGSGDIETAPYNALSTRNIDTNLGAATETAYGDIATKFGIANMRGDGLAGMLVRLSGFVDAETHYENFPNGRPEIKATITGSVAWDWRDAAQSRTDSTTWTASQNPVVHLLNYLIDRDGHGIDYALIAPNLAEWTIAANVCDVNVSLAAGGNERRYRIAMTYALTDPPKDVVRRILKTFDGRCWIKGDGTIGVLAGAFTAPSVYIRPTDILGYQIEEGADPLEAVAGIRGQYMSPTHGYREQDAEPWPTAATVAALTDERVGALDLSDVPSHRQARALMKREYKRRASPVRLTIETTLAGIRARDERFINVEIVDSGETICNTSFEVLAHRIDLSTMQCSIDLLAVDATIDDWTTAEEGTPPASIASLGYYQWVKKDEGTRIGNMTGGGGLIAAFDDGYQENNANCASLANNNGYVGKTFPASPPGASVSASRVFGKAVVYGSNASGFGTGTGDVTLTIYGKNGSAPANATNGTVLGTSTFTGTSDESGGRVVTSNGDTTAYRHMWVTVSRVTATATYCAELDLWEIAQG